MDEPVARSIQHICEKLSDRTATLFLGAGINYGLETPTGLAFPLGQGLSNILASRLLNEPELGLPLDEVAEICESKVGKTAVNALISSVFDEFKPGAAHLAAVQLPWDCIFTTNYDLLIEEAAKNKAIRPCGFISPIFSTSSDLSLLSEDAIPYYKIHGSIDFANTEEGRLILTKEDYRYYLTHRVSLFRRLERDLPRRTFVFIGYSLVDNNLRAVLEDCRQALGSESLPLSFAIRPSFSPVEEAFWRDKYNIQLISADAAEFLLALEGAWREDQWTVKPAHQRIQNFVVESDESSFERVGDSFYVLEPAGCTGTSNPTRFFKGGEPTWADIRDKVAPPRDIYWPLLEALFPELVDPGQSPSAYLVTGSAGTGKSTLLRSVAYAISADFGSLVLVHIPGTPLDARILSPYISQDLSKRIVILLPHASEQLHEIVQFLQICKTRNIPVTLLLEERKNQWTAALRNIRGPHIAAEYELGTLTNQEIESILDALEKFDCAGKLTTLDRGYQRDHFRNLAHKDLLVALRELTSEQNFDDIVRSEFEEIPSAFGRAAYVYVSAVGQLDLSVRYETLQHILGLDWEYFASEVFAPTAGVLLTVEQSGYSRHNYSLRLRTRHPVIASVVFSTAASDDEAKLKVITSLLARLDPGHYEDRRLLGSIVRRKRLVGTLADHEKRRAVYEILQNLLPDDAYVLQHRSILERELQRPDDAVRFARAAVNRDKRNAAFQNTLGLALEYKARLSGDPLQKRALLTEASKIFEVGVSKNPTDAYGYVGKTNVLRQALNEERDQRRQSLIKARILAILEEALEVVDEPNVISSHLGRFEDQFGKSEEAIGTVEEALTLEPSDSRLRDLQVRLLIKKNELESAKLAAMEGIKHDPTSWRLQRHLAQLLRSAGAPIQTVQGHYEAALRHNNGDPDLLVELGAYLFQESEYDAAQKVFDQAHALRLPSVEERKPRQWWTTEAGQRRVFRGRVKIAREVNGHVVATPEGFEAFFWRDSEHLMDMRAGSDVRFYVAFNCRGAIAKIVTQG